MVPSVTVVAEGQGQAGGWTGRRVGCWWEAARREDPWARPAPGAISGIRMAWLGKGQNMH